MTIGLSSIAARNEAIVFTDLDDTIVMMNVDEGQYYELDPIAAKIWTLIEAPRAVDDICNALAGEYDVDPDTCRQDTLEFLQTASENGIVRMQLNGA